LVVPEATGRGQALNQISRGIREVSNELVVLRCLDFPSREPERCARSMKSGFTPRSVALVFALILAAYFGGFYGIEHLRSRKGPWTVEFETNPGGEPIITIRQAALKLSAVKLLFHGEMRTNHSSTVHFDRPQKPVPFGTVLYEDLTFLPGVITFDLFGHEIELLPRVLVINKQPTAWRSEMLIELWPTNKLSEPPRPPKEKTSAKPSKK
jgi:hypothetical protein